MTLPSLNCLSEGENLDEIIRRECAIGFDLRFCRSVAVSENDRDTITCDPPEAEFATLYALTDLGYRTNFDIKDLLTRTAEEKKALAEHRINVVPDPVYGGQLQDFAIPGVDPEGQIIVVGEPGVHLAVDVHRPVAAPVRVQFDDRRASHVVAQSVGVVPVVPGQDDGTLARHAGGEGDALRERHHVEGNGQVLDGPGRLSRRCGRSR